MPSSATVPENRAIECAEDVKEGALAGAGWPHDCNRFSAFER